MKLTRLRQTDAGSLVLTWNDGHEGPVSLRTLRDRCPCAGCSGETVLLRTYAPPPVDTSTPGRYALKGIQQIGNYALKVSWEDGHDLGLYTWEYLRTLCECDACLREHEQ